MRTITFALSPAAPSVASTSALQLARTAIARWRGSPAAPRPPREVVRISPQARYLAQAQDNLKAWIAAGGFTHDTSGAPPSIQAAPPHVAAPSTQASTCCSVLAT